MSPPSRTYFGESAESRIEARRRLLLDTGFALISDGFRQVSIEGLCRAAKLHKRYFYESFADLDELAASVVDELAATLLGIALSAARTAKAAGLGIEGVARASMTAVITYLVSDPRRARVLFTEIADSPRARAHRKATIRRLAHELSAYGHEYYEANQAEPIAEVGSALLLGGSIEVLLSWLDGDIDASIEQLISDLSAVWVLVGNSAVALAKARRSETVPSAPSKGRGRKAAQSATPHPARPPKSPSKRRAKGPAGRRGR